LISGAKFKTSITYQSCAAISSIQKKKKKKRMQTHLICSSFFYFLSFSQEPKGEKDDENQRDPFTKKPRKAVWIRIAAHSCLTALKPLGGARSTVATAAVKASATVGDSDPSEAALWLPLKPFHEDPKSPEELLHSLHFLLFPPPLSYIYIYIERERERERERETKS
jgi:hypothetical protein